MNVYLLTPLLTVIGGLIVAGLVGWIRKSQLVVLVPRTFSYSQITDRGQLVEITIFNRGFKTEEAIDLTLNPALSYEILGANSQTVSIERNRIRIDRIGPSDEVTVLLVIENGTFKPDDITQTISKETKGKTVSKLEEVPPTGQQRINLVALLIGIPLALYAGFSGLEYVVESIYPHIVTETGKPNTETSKSKSLQFHGWTIPSFYKTSSSQLYTEFVSGKLLATIGSLTRKGDLVSVPIRVQNGTERIVTFTASMTTTSSDRRIPAFERRLDNVVVFPGAVQERTVKVIIPDNTDTPTERTVFIEVFIKTTDGDSLSLFQNYLAK